MSILKVKPENPYELYTGDTIFYPHGVNRFTIYYKEDNKDRRSPEEYLQKMQQSGINSLRMVIPGYFEEGIEPELGKYNSKLLEPVKNVFEIAQQLKIYIILCLFDYAGFSPPWDLGVWNKQVYSTKFSDPKDFFGSVELRKYEKERVSFLISNFMKYDNLFAWEPMNEMNYLGKPHGENAEKVTMEWFDDMAKYIKSIDQAHLLTGSLWGGEIWDLLFNHPMNDIVQIHTYDETESPSRIAENIKRYIRKTRHYKKPIIIGEFASKEKNPQRREFIEAAIKAAQSEGSSAWLYASIWDEFGEMDEELFEVYKKTIPIGK
ncbi:MAG: hypothetical protein UX65_C0008G0004 [Parcubacteria group bacterium GW2011_GWB1_46_8]|nr:MAG: hypothetical protein UX14_C0006G0010 [Parcubacteria group bacterium GW2011_GWF1_45_5]KKU43995.1 MAG: hypothetical protein UX61_C0007G0007 [Parcubacteria group bacterium GW2011_GWA2_46_7]KKU46152.1 MAG: hypothetical protein UX65_C0008G0004 [Parcubacteria group bacterium GW2011_GWB1_46_8]KKU47704.1 MAG: hypothetical protein UX66_C0007G0010 [Parcubacteria group bacterium GW2011_GWF2_46_8]